MSPEEQRVSDEWDNLLSVLQKDDTRQIVAALKRVSDTVREQLAVRVSTLTSVEDFLRASASNDLIVVYGALLGKGFRQNEPLDAKPSDENAGRYIIGQIMGFFKGGSPASMCFDMPIVTDFLNGTPSTQSEPLKPQR